jgi:uncharacterized protein (TIGR02594 family)
MPRFISATYHTNIKVAEFICDDGRHLLRCGGTLPWRINNGGDLSSPLNAQGLPAPKKTKNYIGFAQVPSKSTSATYHFFIFPDYETGREQLEMSLTRKYANSTIPQLVQHYAPTGDNDQAKYVKDLFKETGISSEKLVGELSSQEFQKLADAIEKIEGYHNEIASRKEIWIPVSKITATDGARPLADEEIILRLDGKETVLKSNSLGQFPPIVHDKKPVEILHKQANGAVKSIGTLEGEKGKIYNLTTRIQRFFGMPGPDTPPSVSPTRKVPLAYVVQPNDSLAKLATKFKTTSAKIKADNNLKKDLIFPGQKLNILDIAGTPATGQTSPRKNAPKVEKASSGAKPIKKAPPATAPTLASRSDDGKGKPLALFEPDQRRSPWMEIAFREAITYAGKDEEEITKTHNYHRLVTDRDRAGGEVVYVKDKKGKPLLDKQGNAITRTKFDGMETLAGNNRPWCASFVNYCLREAGYAAGRRHASTFGFAEDTDRFVTIKKPIYGAIRFAHRTGGGHVCYVYGQIAGKVIVLGGNQSDQLCFQLRDMVEKSVVYFVPLPYKEQADEDMKEDLPEIDIAALRKKFGAAVDINDAEIKASVAKKKGQL